MTEQGAPPNGSKPAEADEPLHHVVHALDVCGEGWRSLPLPQKVVYDVYMLGPPITPQIVRERCLSGRQPYARPS